MKKSLLYVSLIIVTAVTAMSLVSSCCKRIDAGNEGILVNVFGSDTGVDDVSQVNGIVWYNPFAQNVYEYPTFVQTVDYPAYSIRAKDGVEFIVAPIISLKIIDGQAVPIFRKYRKDLSDIIKGPLFNQVKDVTMVLNQFTTDEIVSMRDSLEKAVERQLFTNFIKDGFQLEKCILRITYPDSLKEVINARDVLSGIKEK